MLDALLIAVAIATPITMIPLAIIAWRDEQRKLDITIDRIQ